MSVLPETLPSELQPGTPYHRLARTSRSRWWRPLLGTVAIVVLYYAWQFALFLGLPWVAPVLFQSRTTIAVLLLLSIAGATPISLLVARWVQRRPAGSLSSVTGRLRGRWLLWCCGASVLYLVPLFVVILALPEIAGMPAEGGDWVGWRRFVVPALLVLLVVPLQAAAEEYVFRGWLIQAIGTYLRSPWPGILVTSVLFSLFHGGGVWAFAYYALFGALLAVLTVRTGGLEAGIALHAVNNVALFLALAATSGTLELDLSGIEAARAAVPWQFPALLCIPLALYGVLVLFLAKRHAVRSVRVD